ncbi:MAG: hypothetical protein Q4D56_12815 [Bacteroides sp.]|nr:hypothetical protein [Bacteroides sp.]
MRTPEAYISKNIETNRHGGSCVEYTITCELANGDGQQLCCLSPTDLILLADFLYNYVHNIDKTEKGGEA